MGCHHTWLDRDLRAHRNVAVEEDMDSLEEDHDVEAARTSNPYVEVEDRIDSIRFLPDSEEDSLENVVVVRAPSMVLHHPDHCSRIRALGVMVGGRHSSMRLRAMKLVLQVDTAVLRHDMMHRHGYQNFLVQLRLVSQLETEVQIRCHNISQLYCDVTGYCKDHHSAAEYR